MGLALGVAIMFLGSNALAKQSGTRVHFRFSTAMTNIGVDPDARGNVSGNLNRLGNANYLRLRIALANLNPNTTYQLAAFIGDDTNSTSVAEFTTDSNGDFAVTYVKKGGRNASRGGTPPPDVLNPICSVRELEIVNGSGQTVLRSDLTDPDTLRYRVRSLMVNTGFIPVAVGWFHIKATATSTQFRLRALGLTPSTAYQLRINGSVAQTNTTDRLGKLNLTTLPPSAPDALDIQMLALTDGSVSNVVLNIDGLGVPCDTTAPTVSATLPANTATNVALGTSITATFSEDMDQLTITNANFILTGPGATVVTGTVTYIAASKTATFTPASNLASNSMFTGTITTGAVDLAGNALAADFVWSFTTGPTPDTTAPTVSSTIPAAGATNVTINSQLSATFSEAMDPLTITNTTFILQQGVTPVAGTVSYTGVTATFHPTSTLAPNTNYTATITTGAADLAGNALAADFVWSFTTGPTPDTTAPTVSATVPANAATNVALSVNITTTFSEAMDPLTITNTTFTLQQGATPLAGTVSYTGVTATFHPTATLAPDTNYTATITTGAADLAGNALAADFVWSFTTGPIPDTTAPTVSSTIPAAGATNVTINSQLSATFSEAMDPLTITNTTFTLQQGATPLAGTVSYTGVTATFHPTSTLAPTTNYTATITTGAADLAGNALAADFVWSFTTGPTPDTTAPTVSATVPANAATNVALSVNITTTFSEAMDPLTLTNTTFTLQQGVTPVAGTITYAGVTATFHPTSTLAPSTNYMATITTGAADLAGNALAADFVWSFTTGPTPDTTAPTVSSTIPAAGATNVTINSQLSATFSEAMDPLTITNTTFTLKQGVTPVTGTVSYVSGTASFAPLTNLTTNTLYTATITTGATDLTGNALATNSVWSFTTSASTDITSPTVIGTNPTNTAINVAINQTINATFSEAMDPLTISTASFTVTGPGAITVTGTVAYVAASKIASFTPTNNLATNTTYTSTITVGFKDLAGNALATNFVWSFTTGTQIETNLVPIVLGRSSTFAILATAAITGGGNQINGDVGISPGTAQGIPASEINGTSHINDQAVIDAQTDLLAGYQEAVGRTTGSQLLETNLGGLTKTPGLYEVPTSTGISGAGPNGILTLDAQGDANAVFVFKMGTTLITGPGTSIVLTGGAQAKNIYWQVGTSATLDTTSIFKGNIMAAVTITVNGGAAVEGRLFAGSAGDATGAVTVQASTVSVPAP